MHREGLHRERRREDRDHNSVPPPCVDLGGTTILAEHGKCYDAPNPPWCTACEPTLPSGDPDWTACSKAGYPTSAKGDPNLCIDFGKDAKGNARGNSCAFACASSSQCPAGFHCSDREFTLDCSQDATTCGTTGACTDTGRKDQNGNPIKWCKCTTAGAKVPECPQIDSSDPTSATRCGDSLQPWPHCIYTHACMPQPMACQK